jgi:hypothetical protein
VNEAVTRPTLREMLRDSPPAERVRELVEHYWRNGTFCPPDAHVGFAPGGAMGAVNESRDSGTIPQCAKSVSVWQNLCPAGMAGPTFRCA